jgi:prepilin-type N-terminal cleavage/methylation domain-containing protein
MIKANNKMTSPPLLSSRPVVSGFTLIEILISLALLTIVLGAIYSSFFSVQSALERFDSVSLKYHEARTALDIMRREIESAILKVAQSEDKPLTGTDFIIARSFEKTVTAYDACKYLYTSTHRGGEEFLS